jgi:hypothetical protein
MENPITNTARDIKSWVQREVERAKLEAKADVYEELAKMLQAAASAIRAKLDHTPTAE